MYQVIQAVTFCIPLLEVTNNHFSGITWLSTDIPSAPPTWSTWTSGTPMAVLLFRTGLLAPRHRFLGGKRATEKTKKTEPLWYRFFKKNENGLFFFFQRICVDVVVFSNIAQWKPVLSVEKKHTKSLRFKKVLSALSPRSKSPPMSRAPHVVRAGGWRIKTKVIQAPKLDIDWYLYVENAWKCLNIIL